MIKFFRKIRHQLLNEGKTSKYFKYAIGEIALVVIGILIALGINNWNQHRLDRQKAVGYLKSLAEDLKSDTIQYNINLKNYKTDFANNSVVLENDDYKLLEVDSIIILVNGYWMLNRTADQTFVKIKNAGIIELLSPEIDKAVNDYYNLDNAYYSYFLEWDMEYSNRDADFWFYNSDYETSIPKRDFMMKKLPFKASSAKRKEDLIKLIESTQGRNHLRNAIVRDEYGIARVSTTKAVARKLLELIANEIGNN
ncbi:DUF6090 family protein [Urechidicola vernalis]|uniref:DUF6090 family protein n=1 Tax=Urechidicola vernalis TaxID=3075600 RepID=A0ABU2Y7D6_9FLAO|nr:DUF6090 family protein [Urechidicola sp. P050]MDT0554104.1 DUF6090 family protein [Urechidicola sp. P050]